MGYLQGVTNGGYALCFPVSPEEAEAEAAAAPAAAAASSSSGGDDTKLNLRAPQHALDRAPLLSGCACFACRRHSRGYLHHLLLTHEMLAQVLLEAHNTHHYQRFFAALRAAVAGGRLAQFRQWWAERKQHWLLAC